MSAFGDAAIAELQRRGRAVVRCPDGNGFGDPARAPIFTMGCVKTKMALHERRRARVLDVLRVSGAVLDLETIAALTGINGRGVSSALEDLTGGGLVAMERGASRRVRFWRAL